MEILNVILKLLGFPVFPEKGKQKFYHDSSTFNNDLSVTGNFISQGNSVTLGATAKCKTIFLLKNPLEKSPEIPQIIGIPGSNIFGISGVYATGNSSFTGTTTFNGTINLFGSTFVNGKNLETELALGKSLPSSDERLKENIRTIENALEKVTSLRGVSFDFKESKQNQIGVIAQEVEKIIPEVVGENPDGYKGVQYGNLVGLLIEAIKEQQEQINQLKSEIELLKVENTDGE